MHDPLLERTLAAYQTVLAARERLGSATPHELNMFWGNENVTQMRRVLSTSLTAIEAVLRIQTTFLFQVNTEHPVKERAVDWHLDHLNETGIRVFDMPASIQASRYTPPAHVVVRQGRRFTPDFFRHLHAALTAATCPPAPARPFKVLELGGGCGHFARLCRSLLPDCRQVIVDLAETLCFAHMFLSLNFPELRTLFVTEAGQLDRTAVEAHDLVFVPITFAEDLMVQQFDLFVNTASLGEMRNHVIQYWMDLLQTQLNPSYLLTVNRYLNTIIPGRHDWRLDENQCSVLFDARWDVLQWEVEPPYTRCPYIQTLTARQLQILAKRLPALPDDSVKRSRRLLAEVLDEDWVRLASRYPPEMTYRDNILASDTTMTGTLFKLWDSIRLETTPDNVCLMLKYLDTLMHRDDREFEEVFYYENLLEALHRSDPRADSAAVGQWLAGRRKRRRPSLQLVDGVGDYNLLTSGDRVFALLKSLGAVALFEERLGERELSPDLLVGSSVDELTRRIAKMKEAER